jgi:hypothetical protein
MADMENNERSTFKPSYFAFATLSGFLADLGTKPLPPQIDRSMMESKSGTDQMNLLSAMKGFGFISDDQHVNPLLVEYTQGDEETRKAIVGRLLSANYPHQLEISAQNGTEKALLDSFGDDFGIQGDTRRKAMTFFLHAARYAGIPLSPHFPATRAGSGNANRARRNTPKKKVTSAAGSTIAAEARPVQGGDTYRVQLRAGGEVTLTVSVSHFALSKNKEDRTFVNNLVDALIDYGGDALEAAPATEASPAEEEDFEP